ncbi:hypothetical protein ACHAQH_000870 [Verticillium albo-atrum]
MTDDDSGGVAALGALLGYVGAEAATTMPFEHLFWPQRRLSNVSCQSLLAAAVLLPMGGPLHKAALATFDRLHEHGIFKGVQRGHMLGTAFYPDPGWTYVQHKDGVKGEPKALRNCLWASAMGLLHYAGDPTDPTPTAAEERRRTSTSTTRTSTTRISSISTTSSHPDGLSKMQRIEKGFGSVLPAAPRARISTYHLTFSPATDDDKGSRLPFVREDHRTPGLRVLLMLVAAESTAIVFAVVLAAVWRTFWAAMWVVPLLLRVVGAAFALDREALVAASPDGPSPASPDAADDTADFEVCCPPSSGDFMIFTGPPRIIQQFTRHYGHPVRNRLREVTQVIVAVIFGCVFPVGLVTSSIFMPPRLQHAWLGYQTILVAGLHWARYSRYTNLSSTEAAISDAFRAPQDGSFPTKSSILFGHDRHGAETLRVDLSIICHGRHADGKKVVQEILLRRAKLGKSEEPEADHASASARPAQPVSAHPIATASSSFVSA